MNWGLPKSSLLFLCGRAIRNGGLRRAVLPAFLRRKAPKVAAHFRLRQVACLLAKQVRSPLWLKICPTRHIFLTRRAPKAAEAILTVFPINAKTAGLSPKTAKRKVQHIPLRCRDAVSSRINYFTLSFRFAPYDRQADEVTICSAWQENYGFVR